MSSGSIRVAVLLGLGLGACARPRPAPPQAGTAREGRCGTPISSTVFHPTGWASNWSHVRNAVAFNKRDPDQMYRIYLVDPDGSNERRFAAANPAFPSKNTGSPYWHPSGDYLAFVAEKAVHPGSSYQATPGWGGYSDLWLASADGGQIWRLTDVPTDADHGTLIPVFSPDGKRLTWAERTAGPNLFNPAQAGGYWILKVADFVVDAAGPRLENIRVFSPGGRAFNETGDFGLDSRTMVVSSSHTTRNFWQNQIFRVDLASGDFVQLTFADYNEHPRHTPSGRILWMSSAGSRLGGTDWWVMDADGSHPEQLSFFNDPDRPESQGRAVWVGTVPTSNWSADGTYFLGDVETNLFTTAGEIRRVQLSCR